MSLPSPVNPFEESADPRGYVPRVACEEVLGRLERHLRAGPPLVLLRGPAGIGKSMVLGVLHQRVAEAWQVVHVAASPSPSVEMSHRILDLLDVDVDADPSSTLVATARSSAVAGRRLLVIIDQATHVPVASSRQLARAAVRAEGDLCILFAVTEGEGAEAFEREIGAEAELATVWLDLPMNAQETSEYIAQRLDQTLDSKTLHDRFDDAAIRWVVDGSAGNPRHVNELACDALQRLERGESLPVRDRQVGASAEPTAGGGSAAPSVASLLQSGPVPYGDSPQPDHSLGGGLLGAGPARDPRELDAARELFPPGFLRSDRDRGEPPGGAVPAGRDGASEGGDAARDADEREAERTPDRGDSMPSGAATERADAFEAGASAERAEAFEAAASADRAAALTDASAAERAAAFDDASAADRAAAIDDASAAGPADVAEDAPAAEPVAAVEGAAAAEGAPTIEAAAAVERSAAAERAATIAAAARGPTAVERAPAAASSKRPQIWMAALIAAAAAGGYLAGRVDPGAVEAPPLPAPAPVPVARDAQPIMPEAIPPEPPAPIAAPEQADGPPPVLAQTAAPSVPATRPPPSPSPPKSKPLPATEPRAEATSATPAASASSARSQPPPREPAAPPAVDDAQANPDGSVTAIVVGARSSGEPRASAYVRVRVQLEPGAILTVDGERVGVAPFSDLIMEPGLHTFVAELPDGLQIEQLIEVTPETGIVEF